MTFAALIKGEFKMLENVVSDRIHQPYRKGLIANFDDVVGFAKDCGALARAR